MPLIVIHMSIETGDTHAMVFYIEVHVEVVQEDCPQHYLLLPIPPLCLYVGIVVHGALLLMCISDVVIRREHYRLVSHVEANVREGDLLSYLVFAYQVVELRGYFLFHEALHMLLFHSRYEPSRHRLT